MKGMIFSHVKHNKPILIYSDTCHIQAKHIFQFGEING